jgi:hypothetical protein
MRFNEKMAIVGAYSEWLKRMSSLAGAPVSMTPNTFMTWMIETEEGKAASRTISDEADKFLLDQFSLAMGTKKARVRKGKKGVKP